MPIEVDPALLKAMQDSSGKPGFAKATQALGTLKRLAAFCGENDPEFVALGVLKHEAAAIREHVAAIDSWISVFIASIGEDA